MRLLHRLGLLRACLMLPWAACAMELTEDTIYDPIPVKGPAPYAPHQEAYLPEQTGYHDDSLDVRVETFRRHDTTVMAVHVRLMDPSQLRTALAAKPPSRKTVVVTTMAKKNNAVLAINGDYFSFHQHGIVVRGGKMWRNRPDGKRDILIVDEKGDFTILPRCTAEDFAGYPGAVMHAFCFGPGLVVDGQALTSLEHADVGNAPPRLPSVSPSDRPGPWSISSSPRRGPITRAPRASPSCRWLSYARRWAASTPITWTADHPPPWCWAERKSTPSPQEKSAPWVTASTSLP